MIVRFEKAGERQYSTTIVRDDGVELRMIRSPGFHEYMPHDLQHFIVEKAFGLRHGIFGQVAVGGSAGTFHTHTPGAPGRERSRQRRAAKRKGKGLMKAGRDDSARSERATIICLHHWLSRSDDSALRRESASIAEFAKSTLEGIEGDERECYTSRSLQAVSAGMDRLSAEWRARGRVEVSW